MSLYGPGDCVGMLLGDGHWAVELGRVFENGRTDRVSLLLGGTEEAPCAGHLCRDASLWRLVASKLLPDEGWAVGLRVGLLVASLLVFAACTGEANSTTTADLATTSTLDLASSTAETTVPEGTSTLAPPTTVDPRQPSRVEVGSLDIVYNCRGAGSPVMVIAHGMGGPDGFDPSWGFGPTLDAIAELTTVCIYGRPGTHGSEARTELPQTIQMQADDLISFLTAVGIDEPPIILGYSWGGLIAQLAAHEHPEAMAGVLLLDSSHWQVDERVGVPPPPPAAPEFVDIAASSVEASVVSDLGTLPLYVLSAADPPPGLPDADLVHPIWLELQNELAALSGNSRHDVLEGVHHGTIPLQAEAITAAVLSLMESVQSS